MPPEDPGEPFVVPQNLHVKHGVVVLENLSLARVADDAVAEFLLVVAHPKVRGATGPGWPHSPSSRRNHVRAL